VSPGTARSAGSSAMPGSADRPRQQFPFPAESASAGRHLVAAHSSDPPRNSQAATARFAAMAMPELISTTRPVGQIRRHALASGFSPPERIVPASTSGSVPTPGAAPFTASVGSAASSATRGGVVSRSPATIDPRSSRSPAFAGAASRPGRAAGPALARRPDAGGHAQPGSGAGAYRGPGSGAYSQSGSSAPARSGTDADIGFGIGPVAGAVIAGMGTSTELMLHRSYRPAPPPMSFRAPAAGPPVPDVARRSPGATGSPTSAGSAGAGSAGSTALDSMAGRSSLVQATAELFRTMRPNQATNTLLDDGPGGQSVSAPSGYGNGNPFQLDSIGRDGPAFPDPVQPAAISNSEMERIVDVVVEKIEQRVIDELERRGRRHNPGVF
ncbi:MAG: hypothetical protein QOJ37_3677, partial [Pseudonocardiales bacterium]|nr:hypothetical protein [Pseudonocardiales bacterium]